MLDDMLAETPERLSSGATDVITPKAANGTKNAEAERAASERWAELQPSACLPDPVFLSSRASCWDAAIRQSDGEGPVLHWGSSTGSDVSSSCDGCRPENHKEAKRKREEIKWEPGSAQKAKKSRGDRAGSREHKHKHKEKYALIPRLLCMDT